MTLKEDSSLINSSPSLKFTAAGVSFLIVFCILAALGSFLSVGKYTQISFTSLGSQILAVYGFFSMIVFGAIYFIVPRVTQSEWGSSSGIQSHLVISMYSIVALTVLHFFGGVWQSGAYGKFDAPLENAIAATKPYSIGASIVWAFVWISVLRFSMNLISLLFRTGRREIITNIVGRNKSIA